MPEIEDIVDIARHRILTASTPEEAAALPKQYETEIGLPQNQTR